MKVFIYFSILSHLSFSKKSSIFWETECCCCYRKVPGSPRCPATSLLQPSHSALVPTPTITSSPAGVGGRQASLNSQMAARVLNSSQYSEPCTSLSPLCHDSPSLPVQVKTWVSRPAGQLSNEEHFADISCEKLLDSLVWIPPMRTRLELLGWREGGGWQSRSSEESRYRSSRAKKLTLSRNEKSGLSYLNIQIFLFIFDISIFHSRCDTRRELCINFLFFLNLRYTTLFYFGPITVGTIRERS